MGWVSPTKFQNDAVAMSVEGRYLPSYGLQNPIVEVCLVLSCRSCHFLKQGGFTRADKGQDDLVRNAPNKKNPAKYDTCKIAY